MTKTYEQVARDNRYGIPDSKEIRVRFPIADLDRLQIYVHYGNRAEVLRGLVRMLIRDLEGKNRTEVLTALLNDTATITRRRD